jgi:hypothetical protein
VADFRSLNDAVMIAVDAVSALGLACCRHLRIVGFGRLKETIAIDIALGELVLQEAGLFVGLLIARGKMDFVRRGLTHGQRGEGRQRQQAGADCKDVGSYFHDLSPATSSGRIRFFS